MCVLLLTISYSSIWAYKCRPQSLPAIATDTLWQQQEPQNRSLPPSDKWALVAGGSKGIGMGIALALAKRNYNLVLVARNSDSLALAKKILQQQFPISVLTLSQDLSSEQAADKILACCTEKNLPISVLCNVAGLGGAKDFLEIPTDTVRYMININYQAPVLLTEKMLPLLTTNAPAYILNVASMAGFAPIPSKNIYSSAKAALINFSYALRYQLKDQNVSVSVLAPGPVYTKPQIVKTTRKELGKFGDLMALPPEKVGEVAVRRMFNKRLLIVPGTVAKLSSWVIRSLPKRWSTALYYGVGS